MYSELIASCIIRIRTNFSIIITLSPHLSAAMQSTCPCIFTVDGKITETVKQSFRIFKIGSNIINRIFYLDKKEENVKKKGIPLHLHELCIPLIIIDNYHLITIYLSSTLKPQQITISLSNLPMFPMIYSVPGPFKPELCFGTFWAGC